MESRTSLLAQFRRVRPGIIAGSADLDPAAVMTAVVAGATFGLSVGWVVLLCIPVLRAVFSVSARIGAETRAGLVQLIRHRYGTRLAIFIAVLVCTVNIAMIIADLMAVSDAFSLILQQPRVFFPAGVAFFVWYLLTLSDYQRVSNWLSLLCLFLFAYVVAAFMVTDSFWDLKGIVLPTIPEQSGYFIAVVAVFGSLLTPDILVWQTSSRRDLGTDFHKDESQIACIIAALISLSAMVAASQMTGIDPGKMTTRLAAEALTPLGALGPVLFSLGIIGSGLVALPILVASMCYSIAEAAGWESGLSKPVWEARKFFVMICAVLFLTVLVNYSGIDTIRVLYFSQVAAGAVIVPILFFILMLANDARVVDTANSASQNFWLTSAIVIMVIANMLSVVLIFAG
jgi:Mn2+/Fe2+ NRAMP family transporter